MEKTEKSYQFPSMKVSTELYANRFDPISVAHRDEYHMFMSNMITDEKWNEEICDELISICSDIEELGSFATNWRTTSRALTKIVSHPRYAAYWKFVAKHFNATPFHLELMLEYPNTPYWFETECAIASAVCISSEIIEELLDRNAVIPAHLNHRLPPRKLWQKEQIAARLLANPSVPSEYYGACDAIRSTIKIMKPTG